MADTATTTTAEGSEPDLPDLNHVLGYLYGAASCLLRSIDRGWSTDSDIAQLRVGVAAYERLTAERLAEIEARLAAHRVSA